MTSAARAIQPETLAWDQTFLEWFASYAGADLFEFERRIAGFAYYQFVARSHQPLGRPLSSFGRSQDRTVAALKCVSKLIERRTMLDCFAVNHRDVPKELQTSNGWAVQQSEALAVLAAENEALERHLLLKSFLSVGWNGFDLVNRITNDEIDLYFLRAICQTENTVAGLVVAKSPYFPGVSVGQCVGSALSLDTFKFWESGIYEAVDRILTLNGQPIDLSADSKCWILKGSKRLLETPFDFSQLVRNSKRKVESAPIFETEVFDLSKKYATHFPFVAAFARSASLIPLYPPQNISRETELYLRATFRANDLNPSSGNWGHPIL